MNSAVFSLGSASWRVAGQAKSGFHVWPHFFRQNTIITGVLQELIPLWYSFLSLISIVQNAKNIN